MIPLIGEWIYKALSDLRSAKILVDSSEESYDQVCFLAQQAIEKLLKAYLIKNNLGTSKTHDLLKLITDCSKINNSFLQWNNITLSRITSYAVDFRYPGETATKEEANEAHELADKLCKFIINELKK